MAPVIGIDLGTTNSCLACLAGGRPKVIPNLDGAPTTPSLVSYLDSGETLVGPAAARQSVMNPTATLFAVKRLIGRKYDSPDVREAAGRLPYKLAPAPNGDVLIDVGPRQITPQEAVSLILGYLKTCAESYLGEPVRDAVVSVPAHFGDHQRQATKDAAQIAGLTVVRVLNEPTAASLSFGLHHNPSGKVAVFDLGGGTFDITLLEIGSGLFHVLATNGDSYLGGEDFDARIADWICERYRVEHGTDIPADALTRARVKEAAERAKKELSFASETQIVLPFLGPSSGEAKHLGIVLSRSQLERLTADLVEKTFPVVERTLGECRLKAGQFDHILLVGGQTRMPLLRRRVAEFFGRAPASGVDPDESVALGAALQAGIIEGRSKDVILLMDVVSLPLGIEIEKNRFEVLIEKNLTIPTRKTKQFTTVQNNQHQVRIHVLQGDAPNASENSSLAVFDLVGLVPAAAGVPTIDVTFEVDADGLLRVTARDAASGRTQNVVVHPSSGLTRQQIDGIIRQQKEGQLRSGRA
jgi:molecular chaperone DnaK